MSRKITLRLIFLMVVFGFVLIISQSYNLKQNGISNAIKKANAVAEVVKSGLTAHMVNGNMDQKNIFLSSIAITPNIKKLWIIRGDNVVNQYGESGENVSIQDHIDKTVLTTGELQYKLNDNMSTTTLRVTIPYNATSDGSLNCMECHNVKYGDTLGGVSIVFDISDIKKVGINNILMVTAITLMAIFIITLMINKMLKPYLETLEILNSRIDSASNGVFKKIDLDTKLPPETKNLIVKFNYLTDSLMDTFEEIDSKLKSFVGTTDNINSHNPLEESKQIISNLYYIYQFKKQIQLDKDREEIYQRLGDILKNQFDIKYINILEINEVSKVTHAYQHGDLDYCTKSIVDDPNNCRVSRNASDVCSVEFQQACPYFNDENHLYYCIDIEIGKSSKMIFNFIFEENNELSTFKNNLPFIKNYIKEVAPEIETKILFQALEDSALKDNLTGLYNRRFLEEHLKKLIPQATREGLNIGMLMLDMDHFKAVNDEYGHDIGDKVLKEFARVVSENVRDSDIVVRFGGEEFIVLLVGIKDEADTLEVANKIRIKVSQNEVDVYAGSTMKKTISIGLSMFPADSSSFTTVMKYADLALYEAKDLGRNQVIRYKENEKDALELF